MSTDVYVDILGNEVKLGDTILVADSGTVVVSRIVDRLAKNRCYFGALHQGRRISWRIYGFRTYDQVLSLTALGLGRRDTDKYREYNQHRQDMFGTAITEGTKVVGAAAGQLQKGTVLKVSEKTILVDYEFYRKDKSRVYSSDVFVNEGKRTIRP